MMLNTDLAKGASLQGGDLKTLKKIMAAGKKMKDENFLMKQQVDKEKRALDKVRRHKDQRLIGISTLIAFTISNLVALLFAQCLKTGYHDAYQHPRDAFWNATVDMMNAEQTSAGCEECLPEHHSWCGRAQ